jgi:tetratricopeptide (TPR) repeat protein
MKEAKVWVEKVNIPTYEIGEAEKNPIFLDKRVYQGSSGKVYPYPTIEKISDERKDKEYEAVFLENDYIKVMILPQLGGRIQRAYDKTNGYDFVYYNHVIKPALVGLTGPWISGGIEFNWPQHHRPTTFLPVDYILVENEGGSKSVLLHDVDQMYGTKGLMKLTVYPDKAYIEIMGQLYNRTSLPQTFLWWANPAVAVNDNTQSIFPPDVHAVMDHGKRDVSRFPIATGIYYKKDYSEGVDISRYKNIPVPTSYMAENSKYDFVGGYDYGAEAGLLHVADHHVSPGKKQWTWGCGDFGKAWDRNLTDSDGPYVELMTGMFTDNQPDFTWLKPFEEKTFMQYFMPYKAVGQVKNATIKAVVNLDFKGDAVKVIVYATSEYENANVILTAKGNSILDVWTKLSPNDIYETLVHFEQNVACIIKEEDLHLAVYADGECIVEYQPEPYEIPKMPEPAKAAKEPAVIMTNEELYLTGQHIEQYRHATYQPDPYYLEGLKRDPGDIRINNAYGQLLMRRGQFAQAEKYIMKALERLIERNPNPYNSETYYLLGLNLLYQGRDKEAYDAFFKATWSNEQQEMSFYYLAAISTREGNLQRALEQVEKALVKNLHNIKARGLKAYLLRKLERISEAVALVDDNLKLDPFDFVSCNEKLILEEGMGQDCTENRTTLNIKMRNFRENYLMTARDYAEFGAYKEAIFMIRECTDTFPLLSYYEAYYCSKVGEEEYVKELLEKAEKISPDYCFPNKLEDISVLRFAIEKGCVAKACYYLGNLFYDKQQWEEALDLWETSANEDSTFPTVFRNLSLVYYNKCKDRKKAKEAMEKAFSLNPKDVRVFLELDQLYKKLGWSFEERLENYEAHKELIGVRDDLYIEYITLVNMCGEYKKAYECIMDHKFHPWEGGEGKITTQYTIALLGMAKNAQMKGEFSIAEELLRKALTYPENLGEGKLEGTKDNHLYYNLGLALDAQGKIEEATKCFECATIGTDEPAGAMYYNDQPADMILYQGLAYLKLGKVKEARSRFYRLIDYGERHLDDDVKIGYFAVSLPEFLIYDDDYTARNRAHCYYLMALGNIGLSNMEKAHDFIKKATDIEPSHMMCRIYGKMV